MIVYQWSDSRLIVRVRSDDPGEIEITTPADGKQIVVDYPVLRAAFPELARACDVAEAAERALRDLRDGQETTP